MLAEAGDEPPDAILIFAISIAVERNEVTFLHANLDDDRCRRRAPEQQRPGRGHDEHQTCETEEHRGEDRVSNDREEPAGDELGRRDVDPDPPRSSHLRLRDDDRAESDHDARPARETDGERKLDRMKPIGASRCERADDERESHQNGSERGSDRALTRIFRREWSNATRTRAPSMPQHGEYETDEKKGESHNREKRAFDFHGATMGADASPRHSPPCSHSNRRVPMKREKRLRARKRPAQSRSRETVDAVLEAAARILARDGYDRTTTNHIAEKAGISIGSLYQYFPSKDAILVALVARHMEDVRAIVLAELAESAPGGFEEKLERLISALIELHLREPELHRILLEEVPHPAELRTRLEKTEDELVDAIAVAGGARTEDARVAGWLVVHAIEALTHHFALHPPRGVSSATFAAMLTRMVRAAMGASLLDRS